MIETIITFITNILDALVGAFGNLSSGLIGDTTPEPESIPLVPLEPALPIDPEVPGQEPLPDAATNPEDPRIP